MTDRGSEYFGIWFDIEREEFHSIIYGDHFPSYAGFGILSYDCDFAQDVSCDKSHVKTTKLIELLEQIPCTTHRCRASNPNLAPCVRCQALDLVQNKENS